VRRIVNRFSGRLATAIAAELLLRGADPELLLGEGSTPPPAWLPHRWVASYDAYRQQVLAAVRYAGIAGGDGLAAVDAGIDMAGDRSSVPGSGIGPASAGPGRDVGASGPQAGLSGGDPSGSFATQPTGTAAANQAAVSEALASAAQMGRTADAPLRGPTSERRPGPPLAAAILSAAVADYQPRQAHPGKLASGQPSLSLELEPTAKVIDLVRQADPELPLVTFKVLHGASDQELLAEARRRLERFQLLVANHAEEVSGSEQSAWLVSADGTCRHQGKAAIASAIVDWLEAHLQQVPLSL